MASNFTNPIPDTIRITLQVTGMFERLGIPYVIGGSVASIVQSEARIHGKCPAQKR
jgi:hypothetical protein